MVLYLAPGVYVELLADEGPELPVQPRRLLSLTVRSRWRAEHTTTVFLGAAGLTTRGVPTRLTNLEQFERLVEPALPTDGRLRSAVRGFFFNGGGSCYVISVGESLSDLNPDDFWGDRREGRSGLSLVEIMPEASLLCAPDVMRAYELGVIHAPAVAAMQDAMLSCCESGTGLFALLDPPPGLDPAAVHDWRGKVRDSDYGAVHYPWLHVPDENLWVPPCGHVAGMLARGDRTYGPHVVPFNLEVRGADSAAINLTREEISLLRPAGLNPIVPLRSGVGIQTARTLSEDPARRKIQWVRTVNFLSRNLMGGMGWSLRSNVDDEVTWTQFGHDIENLLHLTWKGGGLAGATSSEAYRVVCDPSLSRTDESVGNRLEAVAHISLQDRGACRLRIVCQQD